MHGCLLPAASTAFATPAAPRARARTSPLPTRSERGGESKRGRVWSRVGMRYISRAPNSPCDRAVFPSSVRYTLQKVMMMATTANPGERPTPPTPGSAQPASGASAIEGAQSAVGVRDADGDVDCCEARAGGPETPDDELPAATGGVA